jgi:hypothetical protein
MNTIILTPIAERDVHFYLAIAKELKKQTAMNVVFVSFYQPGNEIIKNAGFDVFDPYTEIKKNQFPVASPVKIEATYNTPPLKHLMLHERLTFGIAEPEPLLRKFSDYFQAMEVILEAIESKNGGPGTVVQELAGFIGPLTLFYTAVKRGWKNQFTEPSFFKGRIHFLENNLFLNIPERLPSTDTKTQVKKYLSDALQSKTVVAATKDAHHYMDMGFRKVFNLSNLTKLTKKIYFKYVLQEKQEFEHIWNHSRRYLGMLKNRLANEKHYSHLKDLPDGKRYLYFPFHVQLDFSLTIRCPERLDQLGLLEEVLQHLPTDCVLICKEHPASIGCLDQKRIEKLFLNSQFKLLHPEHNSYDVLDKVSGVLTINSKVGAEAISQGLPVISFGTAFYTKKPFCLPFDNWPEFSNEVSQWKKSTRGLPQDNWIQFLAMVWEDSSAVELYDLKPQNIDNFVSGLRKILEVR